MTARSFLEENGSAVSSQSDQHKTRCFARKWSTPSDRPRVAAQNKIRAALRSAYKIADKAGTRCAHPATSPTNGLDNQLPSALPPWITVILECHSERSEESLATSGPIMHNTEMFRFAQHDSAIIRRHSRSENQSLHGGGGKARTKSDQHRRRRHAEEFLNFDYQSTTKPALKTILSHLQRDDWTRTAFHQK